jgi:hypothetical protein
MYPRAEITEHYVALGIDPGRPVCGHRISRTRPRCEAAKLAVWVFSHQGGNTVRSTVASAAFLLFAAVETSSAQTTSLTTGPEVRQVMVLMAVGPNVARGSQTAVLTFPSERACRIAAEIFAKPVLNVNVIARCAPAR